MMVCIVFEWFQAQIRFQTLLLTMQLEVYLRIPGHNLRFALKLCFRLISKTARCTEVSLALSDFILHKHTPKIPHTLIVQYQYHSLSYDRKFKSLNPGIGWDNVSKESWYHEGTRQKEPYYCTTTAHDCSNVVSLVSTKKKKKEITGSHCLNNADSNIHLLWSVSAVVVCALPAAWHDFLWTLT